jgi:hypothetical protein
MNLPSATTFALFTLLAANVARKVMSDPDTVGAKIQLRRLRMVDPVPQ